MWVLLNIIKCVINSMGLAFPMAPSKREEERERGRDRGRKGRREGWIEEGREGDAKETLRILNVNCDNIFQVSLRYLYL